MTKPFLILFLFLLPFRSATFAAENDQRIAVTVAATESRSGVVTQFLFTRQGNHLRIEMEDHSKPEPVNIIDLAAQKITLIYTHNSNFIIANLNPAPQASPPGSPAARDSAGAVPGTPGASALTPATSAASPLPAFPPMPAIPAMAGMPAMPAAPGQALPRSPGFGAFMMPPMPPIAASGPALELKKTGHTKKIQGLDCTLYTVADEMQTMEIWATPDAGLFPFRLLELSHHTRHFGPPVLEDQWVEILRKQSLFPLEATLRVQNSKAPAHYSFKVDKIDRKEIGDENLFKVPEGYNQSPVAPF